MIVCRVFPLPFFPLSDLVSAPFVVSFDIYTLVSWGVRLMLWVCQRWHGELSLLALGLGYFAFTWVSNCPPPHVSVWVFHTLGSLCLA